MYSAEHENVGEVDPASLYVWINLSHDLNMVGEQRSSGPVFTRSSFKSYTDFLQSSSVSDYLANQRPQKTSGKLRESRIRNRLMRLFCSQFNLAETDHVGRDVGFHTSRSLKSRHIKTVSR